MDLVDRTRLKKSGPESTYKVETYYSDYRISGGIKLPRKIRATAHDGDLVPEVHAVHTDTQVEHSVFRED